MLQMSLPPGAFFDQSTFLLLQINRLAAILAANADAIGFMIVNVSQCPGLIAAHLGIDGEQSTGQVEATGTSDSKSIEVSTIVERI